MKARWGSCTSKGKISLNPKLVQMPKDLIDYVILHESCHLKELNHSSAFYALLDRVLPERRERRQRLNGQEVG
jgi:predicted metal-dependent hydrolase